MDAYAPLFTLIIQSFSAAFTKRPDRSTGVKNRPILMLMDEFPQLTFSYKMINSTLSTLRSKSVICMLIMQNYAQLESRYNPVGARSLIGNCGVQIILGSNDYESSQKYSKLFGTKKDLSATSSMTRPSAFNYTDRATSGRSIQEKEIPVFPPQYFGDLPERNKLILYFNGRYAELTKLNCYKS